MKTKILFMLGLLLLCVVGVVKAEEITGYKNTNTTIMTACIHNGQLIDYAHATITIYDDVGSKIIDNQSMFVNYDGKFYYTYNFSAVGWYSTKETCDFGILIADDSTKIHIIDYPTTLVNTNSTLMTILNDLNTAIQKANNISYQQQQFQNSISGINTSINNINVSGGSGNANLSEITGLIVAQTEKPPYLDVTSVVILVLMALWIITIWVRNVPYFVVVGFVDIAGGVIIGLATSPFIGLIIGCIGIMYLIGAGLKSRE
jgi:hypothetical protein